MTFIVGQPGHTIEHNALRATVDSNTVDIATKASAADMATALALKVAKAELVINVDDQAGATDDAKIDAAIAAAAASAATGTVLFASRQYTVNASHALTSLTDVTLSFSPGSSVKIGEAPTGELADRGRVFALDLCSRVVIDGLHVLAPTTPLAGTPTVERAIVQILRSSDCVVQRSTFDLTNLWAAGNTYVEPSIGTFQYCASAVFLKGPTCERNLIANCAVTGGIGVVYAYNGSAHTTVRNVTVTNSPENGFSGLGNVAAWSDDNVLDTCVVLGFARIGIEDWNKIRRTTIRDCRVTGNGIMGFSCMSASTRAFNIYVEGTLTYAGFEITSSNSQINGGRIVVASTTPAGIIVDGNVALGNGDTTSTGALITGTEVHGGLQGITMANTANPGQIRVTDCAVYDWVQRGISLANNPSGSLPAIISGCYLENRVPSVSVPAGFRLGIQGNTGARIVDTELRLLAAANNGAVTDVPIFFGDVDQTFINVRIDGGGITLPVVPISTSVGGAHTGLVVSDLRQTGGATVSFASLTTPRIINVTGTITAGNYLTQTGAVLAWNGDTNLYRSAADTLKTDDTFNAVAGLQLNGVAVPSISSTSTLTNKTLTSPAITTPTGIVKGDVGLGNVDNTSDANKPVSTAQATADGLALPKSGGTMSGTLTTLNLAHTGTTAGFYSATAVTKPTAYTQTYATATKTVNAYTTDTESSVYTGAADSEAKLVDLNSLRVAYENLRLAHDNTKQVLNSLIDDLQALGLVG